MKSHREAAIDMWVLKNNLIEKVAILENQLLLEVNSDETPTKFYDVGLAGGYPTARNDMDIYTDGYDNGVADGELQLMKMILKKIFEETVE